MKLSYKKLLKDILPYFLPLAFYAGFGLRRWQAYGLSHNESGAFLQAIALRVEILTNY
jgi:hypothetical protein